MDRKLCQVQTPSLTHSLSPLPEFQGVAFHEYDWLVQVLGVTASLLRARYKALTCICLVLPLFFVSLATVSNSCVAGVRVIDGVGSPRSEGRPT